MKKSLTRHSFLQGAGLASAASRTPTVLGSPLHYTQTGPSPPGKPFLGLKLSDPFIAITTNSLSRRGSFRNTALEIVRAYGTDGKEIPIVVASHRSVGGRVRDFRTGGLEFDGGIGAIPVTLDVNNRLQNCTTCSAQGRSDCLGAITLYPEFPLCRDGIIAFARGRNEYYSGGLCEAYPEVQGYWLDWIGECLAAGVDGLDIRISNHSTWSDHMDLYGFNWNSRDGQVQGDLLELVFRHGGYSGYNFYETASFYDLKKTAKQGRLAFFPGMVEGIRSRAKQLGLI